MEAFLLEYRLTVNFPDGAYRHVLLLERWLGAVVRGESVSITFDMMVKWAITDINYCDLEIGERLPSASARQRLLEKRTVSNTAWHRPVRPSPHNFSEACQSA